MLDWMKGVIHKKAPPIQRLIARDWADDAERQALLSAVANDPSVAAPELLPLLSAEDAAVAQRAPFLFLSRADSSALAMLLDLVVDGQPNAPPRLASTLIRANPEVLSEAVDLALDRSPSERLAHVWEIVTTTLPTEQTDRLILRALEEGPPSVRLSALGRFIDIYRSGDAKPTLIAKTADRDPQVRQLALVTLAELQGHDVLEVMLDRLGNEQNVEVRAIAGRYVQTHIASAPPSLRPELLGRLLLTSDSGATNQLVKGLLSTGDTTELLFELLTFCKSVLGAQHARVMEALQTEGERVAPLAFTLLGHADPDIRIQALLLLTRLAAPGAAEAAARLLGDDDWWVRIMACEALGRLKDERAAPLLEALLTDPDAMWAAIEALGQIGGAHALAAIVGRFVDPRPELRLAAINAAVGLADPRVDAHLEAVTRNDAVIENRVRAVEILRERRGAVAESCTSLAAAEVERPMDKVLAFARDVQASDLHISPGEPPILRLHGSLIRSRANPVSAAQTEALLDELLDPIRRPILMSKGAVDFCHTVVGVGRYRVNVYAQQRGLSATFRTIPNLPPTLSELGLPKDLASIASLHQGIVLLTGPAGSGKSTSLAALVNVLNETQQTHVITLEDPIEFLHPAKMALINQREIGRDSRSFATAIRGALREDPDVIVVGELRDPESTRLALLAAETGHLVIASMQTTGAVATVDKLVEMFPTDEQRQVRVALAGSLKLVVSQLLVPRADGKGRVAAFEILRSTSGVRALIRDGKTFQLPSAMTVGRGLGMLTLDAHLDELQSAGLITLQTACEYASNKAALTNAATPGSAPRRIASQVRLAARSLAPEEHERESQTALPLAPEARNDASRRAG